MSARKTWDAVVVGGGFAGVAAARELRHNGQSVLLLEARDRVGGRTYSATRDGELVELGGAFVHWWQGNAITEVIRYGLDVEYVPFLADRCFWPDENGPRDGTAEQLNAVLIGLLEAFMSDARDVLPRPFDPLFKADRVRELDRYSVADRLSDLALDPAATQCLAGVLCSVSSGQTRDVGLLAPMRWFAMHRWSSLQFMEREHYRIVGGIRRLAEAMLADANCEVRLESPVAAVSQDRSAASVLLRDGTEISTRAAIIAVPASALRTIELPEDAPAAWRSLANDGAASRGLKVTMSAPAGMKSVFAVGPESAPITWLITESQDRDATRLVGFGPDGDRIDCDDLDAVQAAVSEIAPGTEILDAHHYNWCDDEFSQGTWGFLRPGQVSMLPDLTRPHGRLVLAGGDIGSSWPALVTSALESGIRAAQEVQALLGGLKTP